MAFKDYRDLIRQMEREMQQLTDEAYRGFFVLPMGGTGRFWQPAVDIHETDGSVLVKMELAGTRADDLQVSLSADDRVLTVSGTRVEARADQERRTRCHQLEIYFGPFERAVGLPVDTPLDREAITASFRDGFLIVTLPKRSAGCKPLEKRSIPITGEDGSVDSTETESEGE